MYVHNGKGILIFSIINKNEMNKWNIKFDCPKDSDYEEGRFSVDITFSLDYPNPFLLTNFIMMYFIQI